jgi:flagellar hook-associated protein 1
MLGGQTDLVAGKTVNKLVAAGYVPTGPVVSSGGPVAVPIAIKLGVNDTLNLKVDGAPLLKPITLDPTNTSLAAVTADINKQLIAAGSTAVASTDTQGRLEITSPGSTGATASVQVLAGTANATLGLSTSVPPQARVMDSNGNDVTSHITGGQLGGNLTVRNQDISAVQGDPSQTGSLNQLAKAFADRVNTAMGIPLFTYDNTSATNIANSFKVNSSVTAQQLPNTQAITVGGTLVASAIAIKPGVNDTLNLNVDGTAWPTITLNSADTNAASVAADLNQQFKTLGIGAGAAVNPSGGLSIGTTNTAPTASIQVLPGKANTILGLAKTTPTQGAANGVALSLSALSNPSNAADEINGQSYTQFFGSIAAQVGSQLSLAQNGQSLQKDMVTQAQSLRQQVSGVDLNTEATQVLQLQSSYQAASKMMTVVDNLIQTVLALITPGSTV